MNLFYLGEDAGYDLQRIPEQRGIRWLVDIGEGYRSVDPALPAFLDLFVLMIITSCILPFSRQALEGGNWYGAPDSSLCNSGG